MDIKRINNTIRYNKNQKKVINRLKPWNGEHWSLKTNEITKIKIYIKEKLIINQGGRCAYCGNKFEITSAPEIEHIAAKGGRIRAIYPEFTFTPLNLVLACHLCNSPRKKGQIKVIENLDKNYKVCTFKIIHPYFDNPEDHIQEMVNNDEYGIIFTPKSLKGENTIQMFDLNKEVQFKARADNFILERLSDEFKNDVLKAFKKK